MGKATTPPPLEPERTALRARLTRAHGHLHAVIDMIDAQRSDAEVLRQLSAVRAALDRATGLMVDEIVARLAAGGPDGERHREAVREAVRTLV